MSEASERPVEAKDFMDKAIVAGVTICYPVRRGSSMWLKKLTVEAVRDTPRGISVSGVGESGRRVSIFNLNNCVVVS